MSDISISGSFRLLTSSTLFAKIKKGLSGLFTRPTFRWLARRLSFAILTLFIMASLNFILLRLRPEDPVAEMYEALILEGYDPETAKYLVQEYYGPIDLDKPLYVQYLNYLWSLLRGDLGKSLATDKPVIELIASGLPWTALLVSVSLFLSFTIGTSLGTLMAYRRGTKLDTLLSTLASLSDAMPDFAEALILLVVLGWMLGLFPTRGAYDPMILYKYGVTEPAGLLSKGIVPVLELLVSILYHLALPVICFVWTTMWGWALAMKSNIISVLGEEYVLAALRCPLRFLADLIAVLCTSVDYGAV